MMSVGIYPLLRSHTEGASNREERENILDAIIFLEGKHNEVWLKHCKENVTIKKIKIRGSKILFLYVLNL